MRSKTTPPKPGMLRVERGAGSAIKLEIWALSPAAFGKFVAAIPPPLSIGTVRLGDGREAKGFLVEPAAINGARDISAFGGWRAFMAETGGGVSNRARAAEYGLARTSGFPLRRPRSTPTYTDTA